MNLHRIIALTLLTSAACLAQDFTDGFEQGLSNWTAIWGSFVTTSQSHTGTKAAVNPPGAAGIVRLRRNVATACTGTFSAWFNLNGATVDSRLRICVNPSGTQWYGVWFDPLGTDNPMWQLERGTSTQGGVMLATGSVPPILRGQWFKMSIRREAGGRLTASINDSYVLTAVDNNITQPGGFEIPAYQDNGNSMIFDDVEAVNTSASCATSLSPQIDSTSGTFNIAGHLCDAAPVDTAIRFCNTGTGNLEITSVVLGGAGGNEWRTVGFAPLTLAANQCGTILFRYTPIHPYGVKRVTSITLQTNADNLRATRGSAVYVLNGRKDTLAFAAKDSIIDFGDVLCTTPTTDTVFIVRNVSTAAGVVSFTQPSAPFSVLIPKPGSPLQPGDSIVCDVRFTNPVADSIFTSSFVFSDSCGNQHTVKLRARVRMPVLHVSTMYDFGTLTCDSARFVNINIYNSGSATASLDFVHVHPPFSLTVSNVVLKPDSTSIIQVRFQSPQAGTFIDTITILRDGCGDSIPIVLTGRKDNLGISVDGVQPNAIDWGVVCPGEIPKDTVITIVNASTVPLQFGLTISPPFIIVGIPDATPLAVNERRPITIHFDKSADNLYTGTLSIHDSCGEEVSVNISIRVAQTLLSTQTSIDFGSLLCDDSRTLPFTIQNTGVRLAKVHWSMASGPFTLSDPSVQSALLFPGTTYQSSIQFHPTHAGTFVDTIVITADQCGAVVRIPLSGVKDSIGYVLENIPASDTIDFGTDCPLHSPVNQSFIIVNTSSVPLSFSAAIAAPFSLPGTAPTGQLAVGEHRQIYIEFNGLVDSVYQGTLVITDSCGNSTTIYLTGKIESPDIGLPAEIDTTVCTTSSVTVTIPVWNFSTVSHTLNVTSFCQVIPATITLAAGEQSGFTVTVSGSATVGTTSCPIAFVDECGSAHNITVNVTSGKTPVSFSLSPNVASTRDGDTVSVSVLTDSPLFLTPADSVTLHITSDFTTLELVGASVGGQALPVFNIAGTGSSTVIITGVLPSQNAVVAQLLFRTLIGSTLSPTVRLDSASNEAQCTSAFGSGTISLPLLPHGCELNTVSVHPFTSSMQSVFPNPTSSSIAIDYSLLEETSTTFTLSNSLGQIVRRLTVDPAKPGTYQTQLSTMGLDNGLYVLAMHARTMDDTRLIGVIR